MTVVYDSMSLAQLNFCRFPVSDNNVKSMVIWAVSENANGNGAHWNIWDTTEGGEPGEDNFNSAGVKNYPTIEEGMDAFSRTLHNGRYPGIISALQRSAPPAETCNMICNSPWGSKPTPQIVAEVLANFNHYANLVVGGSGPEVIKPPIEVPSIPPVEPPNIKENNMAVTQGTQLHVFDFSNPAEPIHWWQDSVGPNAGKWYAEVMKSNA